MCQKRTPIIPLTILFFAIMLTTGHSHAADNPFEGFWRSASGTVVQIKGDHGVIISATEPGLQNNLNQISIKNIRPQGEHWAAEELFLTDNNQNLWLTVDWRVENDRIIRAYSYDGTASETYFTRIDAEQARSTTAAAFPPAPVKNSMPVHSWLVGAALSHITYEEPDLMEEKGFMFGLNAAYAYHQQVMLRAEAGFSFGSVDYSSPISGEFNGIPNFMFEVRGLAGYDFTVSSSTIVTPFAGLGYRYLSDDSSGMVTNLGAAGYLREANYLYSPIGITTYSTLNSAWSLDATLEYDLFWNGLQKSHLSDANLGYSDIENEQNNGYGVRASLNLYYDIDNATYVFGPFVRYWDIDISEEEPVYRYGVLWGSGVEPANTSIEFGFNFAVLF